MKIIRLLSIFLLSLKVVFLISINIEAKVNGLNSESESGIESGKTEIIQKYNRLPLYFIKNNGQLDEKIKYYERGGGHRTFFTTDSVYFSIIADRRQGKFEHVQLKPVGLNRDVEIVAEHKQKGKVNYLKGQDSAQWKTGIPLFGSVLYKNIYKDIDMRFYGNQGTLEYDIIVKPGAETETVRLKYERVKQVSITGAGDLEVNLNKGMLLQKKPYIYQELDGRRMRVNGEFIVLESEVNSEDAKLQNVTLGFQVASYDKTRTLVIDPAIVYSVYPGGGGDDLGYSIAVDSSGYAYITGETWSAGYLISQGSIPFQSSNAGLGDAFVTKLDITGVLADIVYSTYLGGSEVDSGRGIAIDSFGNAYIAGETSSLLDFPITSPSLPPGGGVADGFVSKLNADGTDLLFSTYLGGDALDSAEGITVDSNGDAYITGGTSSSDFSASAYQLSNAGGDDAFITKLGSNGSLMYSTYLGGTGNDYGHDIALSSDGSVCVTGETDSTDFPEVPSLFGNQGQIDAFVTKFNIAGTALAFSTYLGGSNSDYGYSIAVDSNDSIYITGETLSLNFPVSSPFQANQGGGSRDAFVTKIDSGGSLVYSTYLGGDGDDYGFGIALGSDGSAYITGETASTNFPVQSQLFSNQDMNDAFVTKLNPDGTALVYSTYLKGNKDDIGWDIAIDNNGDAYVVGQTLSDDVVDFPSAALSATGETNAFVIKISDQCGNGVVDTGETCDDGNNVIGDGCDASCLLEAGCGNGVLDAGEICDDGNNVSGDGCSASCNSDEICGNGVLDTGEDCDDGNIVDGDGCDALCIIEANNGGSNGGGGNGGGGGGGGGGCFIATAAYGSYMADDVMVLREFRDRWMLTNTTGRALVDLYYKTSPPVADYISGNNSLRMITRIILVPVVFSVKNPYGIIGITFIGILSMIILRRRAAGKI